MTVVDVTPWSLWDFIIVVVTSWLPHTAIVVTIAKVVAVVASPPWPRASQGIAHASAGREVSYMGPRRSRTRQCRRARAACERGVVGNGNGGLHRAQGMRMVGNGRARFGAARNLADVAVGVGNVSGEKSTVKVPLQGSGRDHAREKSERLMRVERRERRKTPDGTEDGEPDDGLGELGAAMRETVWHTQGSGTTKSTWTKDEGGGLLRGAKICFHSHLRLDLRGITTGHPRVILGLPVPVPAETRTRGQGYGYPHVRVRSSNAIFDVAAVVTRRRVAVAIAPMPRCTCTTSLSPGLVSSSSPHRRHRWAWCRRRCPIAVTVLVASSVVITSLPLWSPSLLSPPPSSLRRRVRTRQCLGTNGRRAICEAIGSVHRDVMSIATWECIWVWIGLTMKSAETSQLIIKKHSAEPSPCEFGSRGDPAGVTGARRSDSGVFKSQCNRERTRARAGDGSGKERLEATRGDVLRTYCTSSSHDSSSSPGGHRGTSLPPPSLCGHPVAVVVASLSPAAALLLSGDCLGPSSIALSPCSRDRPVIVMVSTLRTRVTQEPNCDTIGDRPVHAVTWATEISERTIRMCSAPLQRAAWQGQLSSDVERNGARGMRTMAYERCHVVRTTENKTEKRGVERREGRMRRDLRMSHVGWIGERENGRSCAAGSGTVTSPGPQGGQSGQVFCTPLGNPRVPVPRVRVWHGFRIGYPDPYPRDPYPRPSRPVEPENRTYYVRLRGTYYVSMRQLADGMFFWTTNNLSHSKRNQVYDGSTVIEMDISARVRKLVIANRLVDSSGATDLVRSI
ncbi:hypothetical protein EDB85DRAFT_2175319 [Lactarius pseudohatsudake]|nr:hypothetical protein EDB85DRAFT_2175319 [Lactarius pseudohatsudake]